MKLFHGDCLIEMNNIPDHSVDLILCDLPYGSSPCSWDVLIPFDEMWNCINRVIKSNGAVVLFGQEPFSSLLRVSNIKNYKYDWIWKKERFTNIFQVKRRPGKILENISVFYKKQPTYNPQMTIYNGPIRSNKIGETARFSVTQSNNTSIKPKEYIDNGTRYPLQILDIKRDSMYDIKYHPTQKPVELLEYLIKTYTNEGDVVLDFCMGSGSTGVACINTKRHFIGIEKDDKYFEIATKRINDIKNGVSCEENE